MPLLAILCLLLLCGRPDHHMVFCGVGQLGDVLPRKAVSYNDDTVMLFRVDGVWNYSSMLLREDLGLLLLGAREVVYAVDVRNISHKMAEVWWSTTQAEQTNCMDKGKTSIDCWNYIRVLHVLQDGRMYVCGTNAYRPTCDYMVYEGGQLSLLNTKEDGKGKCPFDPYQSYTSLVVDGALYAAAAINFLGSDSALLRNSSFPLRTDIKDLCAVISEPRFISMEEVPESQGSTVGDDDKVYLFFNEVAVEYDFYSKLTVSRVARVCKGDMGGQWILQKKWTSFLKARLDCPVLQPSLPFLLQDVFLWRDSDWRKSVFYAVFTSQSGSADLSAVCAYNVEDVSQIFSTGSFKTPVSVESYYTKWILYSRELPVPRPGACIDDAARQQGIRSSLDLPDKVLQFVQTRALMDPAAQPLSGGPLLVKRGALVTRITVVSVAALDGQNYTVMFIGTDNGFVEKAVNYNGETFIIEEIQLFSQPVPIEVLRLSVTTGYLYAGSSYGAAQVPLSACSRYRSCIDCVLARDPYCAWDVNEGSCTTLAPSQSLQTGNLIQSLKNADASQCPNPEDVVPETVTFTEGSSVKLPCQPSSNLAELHWLRDNQLLNTSGRSYDHEGSLVILKASAATAGRYECQSVESAKGRKYTTTMAVYELLLDRVDQIVALALKVVAPSLAALLTALLGWNLHHGHLHLPHCRHT
ncbi:semaphorin-4E-like [Arapaima gigas]